MLDVVPEVAPLMRGLSGDYADRYVGELVLPPLTKALGLGRVTVTDLKERLMSPYGSLEALYGVYAFARRGKERVELGQIALKALHRTTAEAGFEQFLRRPDADSLWASFCEVTREHGRKPMEQLNRGVVAGLAELAQEIYRLDGQGSISRWVVDGVLRTDRVEPQFLRIVDIRGVGPKLASLFLRDLVFLQNLERGLDFADRIYVQPVDKWTRVAAPFLLQESDAEEYADWILAGKIAKVARLAGVSGIRLNMGISYFGTRVTNSAGAFRDGLRSIPTASVPRQEPAHQV